MDWTDRISGGDPRQTGRQSWSRGHRSSSHTFQIQIGKGDQGVSPMPSGEDVGGGVFSDHLTCRPLWAEHAPAWQACHSPSASLMRA